MHEVKQLEQLYKCDYFECEYGNHGKLVTMAVKQNQPQSVNSNRHQIIGAHLGVIIDLSDPIKKSS